MSQELALEKKVSPLVTKAEELVIESPKDMEVATEMLSKLNKLGDAAEEEKNKVMRPALDVVAAERKRWKPLETVLEGAIGIIRKKMSAYQTEAKRIADEKAKAIEARIGEGKGKLKLDTAVAQIDALDTPEEKVMTGAGSVKFRTDKKFEVVDISKLPVEYLLANEVAIRTAMKDGKEVPGVRYFTEEVPINHR